eukprot:TRINITY_DN20837_c0_g1_i4.p2 TRINITY_DN20837_c0_g1~~TRINITY_DN20837_c0_g1_i4.p2  ORF type:complete len:185 (-),score=-33.51 TRINITY_DN20837_c0_g1_i4:458-1012(-)
MVKSNSLLSLKFLEITPKKQVNPQFQVSSQLQNNFIAREELYYNRQKCILLPKKLQEFLNKSIFCQDWIIADVFVCQWQKFLKQTSCCLHLRCFIKTQNILLKHITLYNYVLIQRSQYYIYMQLIYTYYILLQLLAIYIYIYLYSNIQCTLHNIYMIYVLIETFKITMICFYLVQTNCKLKLFC